MTEQAPPPPDEPSNRAVARRSIWVVGDQVFSSVTNFALSVLVARNVSAAEFGSFGVAFATYLFLLALSTGMWSAPVAVTHSDAAPETRLEQVARSAGAALVTGVLVAPVMAIVAWAIGGSVGAAMLPMAIFMPGLLLQNAWRQGFITHAAPQKALVNDAIWGVLQIAAVLVVVSLVDSPTAAPLIAAWAAAGAIAGLLASLQARRLPRIAGGVGLLREHRHLGPNFVGEAFVINGQAQVTLIALAAISGTTATAGYRGAIVAFGPQRVLSNGLAMAALPEAVRIRRTRQRLQRMVQVLSGFNTLLVVAVGGMLMALPDTMGQALLGSTWDVTEPVLLPMTVFGITGTIASGPSVGLRAIGKAGTCLRNQLKISPLALVGTLVGMIFGGAVGAAWGLAAVGLVSAAIWTISWRTHFGEYTPTAN